MDNWAEPVLIPIEQAFTMALNIKVEDKHVVLFPTAVYMHTL